MIKELKAIIKDTTEEEAKSLLFLILLRTSMLEEKTHYTEVEFVSDLRQTYHDFVNYKQSQANEKINEPYKVLHILFGDSAAGSLKQALKEMKLENEEKVISFSDKFSTGPISQLHDDAGLNKRYQWIKNHLNYEGDDLDEYIQHFKQTTSMIDSIPTRTPIIIWVGENAHEQTALRYVLYLLKEKEFDISIINTTKQFKNKYNIPDTDCYPLHTGEIASERLTVIYEEARKNPPISQEQRKELEEDWNELSSTDEVLRIWENNKIKSVSDDYYDDYIINKAKKLYKSRNKQEFLKSARLIGEVIGYLDQYIGDVYIEYRVRHLITSGVFEIEGVPKAMRFYSVRFKD
ncbi:DUF1835 domain-containing protein [Metabacillus malikii]|uniref:DUF1835 domain-containing protein n=1 Tax=Metabacillus malikii TaxID=1504265 RepID=A0ABT9ZMU3_9BACI|nr:DUF1835 domain-containing protein [Metabacillus malikii]MDQ0233325.1 hypothetical protein [Metabacillus malikii]